MPNPSMIIRALITRSRQARPSLRLDDSLDGRDALFSVQWGGSVSLSVIEFDCWSVYSDAAAAHHARYKRARRVLYLPATLTVLAASGVAAGRADLSLLWWSAATLLAIAVAGQLLENYAAARSRRRWDRNPLLECIHALGGFAGLPVIWGRNIPAVVRLEAAADHKTKAAELAAAYKSWVEELAGVYADDAIGVIETLSDEYHGTLGDLRVTAAELV